MRGTGTPSSNARDRSVSNDGMAVLRAGIDQGSGKSLEPQTTVRPAGLVATDRRQGITPAELIEQRTRPATVGS